ncbi:MAG: VanZ family protein [Burkholderiales bacterium]
MSTPPQATGPSSAAQARSQLLPFLMGAYALLIVNASLYPFSGWRAPAEGLWAYLASGWPRYLNTWEIPLNVAGYVPLGFALALHFLRRHPWPWALSLATLAGTGLSFCLESLQSYLPARIASNLDLASNGAGAFIGAACGCFLDKAWSLRERLHAFRSRRVPHGVTADFAITLTLVWLFVQLNPELGFLGTADLGTLLGHEYGLPYSARTYLLLETLQTTLNLAGIGAFLGILALSRRSWIGGAAILLGCGALLKALAGHALLKTPQPWVWLTPSLAVGVLAGALLLGLWYSAGASMKTLGLSALLGACVLSWVVPVNPYLAIMVRPIAHGHVSSINGATWWVAQLWPWMAMLCLLKLPQARHASARHP